MDINVVKLGFQVGWESYVRIAERKAISFCWRFSQQEHVGVINLYT